MLKDGEMEEGKKGGREEMDEWKDGGMAACMIGWMMDGRGDEKIDDGWMDGWMDGWLDGWMVGWRFNSQKRPCSPFLCPSLQEEASLFFF